MDQTPPRSERAEQLVTQLGIMDNRLIHNHSEVKSKMIDLVDHYEAVFTKGTVTMGKTDLLKMQIVLIVIPNLSVPQFVKLNPSSKTPLINKLTHG